MANVDAVMRNMSFHNSLTDKERKELVEAIKNRRQESFNGTVPSDQPAAGAAVEMTEVKVTVDESKSNISMGDKPWHTFGNVRFVPAWCSCLRGTTHDMPCAHTHRVF
jgi:hypothetical protein